MFALTDADLNGRILGCADGPAAFNAEATRQGGQIVSCDPLYRFDAHAIRERIDQTYAQIMDQLPEHVGEYVWTQIASIEDLGIIRMRAMAIFLDDYAAGCATGRYIDAELPDLPFPAASFDLAVCSHFLFLYSTQLTQAFHLAALDALCRVASEVRIFPVLALEGRPSPYLEAALAHMEARGFNVSIEAVHYEFLRGANQMMRVRR